MSHNTQVFKFIELFQVVNAIIYMAGSWFGNI